MSTFNQKRRQQLLNEQNYIRKVGFLTDAMEDLEAALFIPEQDDEHRVRLMGQVADWSFERFLIRHTGGESFLELRDEVEAIIVAYERYSQYRRKFENDPQFPPFYFAELLHHEQLMQLIGLCYLLHRRDLLPWIAAMEDRSYESTDTLYEDLLAYEMQNRYDVDQWYHDKSYRHIINALYRNTSEESLADLQSYLTSWYPSMESVPWHGSHTRMTAEGGDYFGYWAFEAGAVAYLLDLDDATIDHIVYPKHAVEFARDFEKNRDEYVQRGRCEALLQCPRAGYWYAPEKQNSRRRFTDGEVMPDFPGSSWGATIWYWDQGNPPIFEAA